MITPCVSYAQGGCTACTLARRWDACKKRCFAEEGTACGDEPTGRQQRLYSRRDVELVSISGRTGVLLPRHCHTRRGVLVHVVPRFGAARRSVILALEEGINLLPGFSPDLRGYSETDADGIQRLYGYVLK